MSLVAIFFLFLLVYLTFGRTLRGNPSLWVPQSDPLSFRPEVSNSDNLESKTSVRDRSHTKAWRVRPVICPLRTMSSSDLSAMYKNGGQLYMSRPYRSHRTLSYRGRDKNHVSTLPTAYKWFSFVSTSHTNIHRDVDSDIHWRVSDRAFVSIKKLRHRRYRTSNPETSSDTRSSFQPQTCWKF